MSDFSKEASAFGIGFLVAIPTLLLLLYGIKRWKYSRFQRDENNIDQDPW